MQASLTRRYADGRSEFALTSRGRTPMIVGGRRARLPPYAPSAEVVRPRMNQGGRFA